MVAYDSVSSAAGATIASSTVLTFSHTGVGNNLILLAGIAVDSSADGSLSCTCTYGGSAMTSLGVVHSGNTNAGFLQVFAIEAPPQTANVVATVAGGTPANLSGGSIALSGAAAPVAISHGTPATNTGTGATTSTCTLPSSLGTGIIVGFTCSGTSIASATAPSTSRFIKSQAGTGAASSVAGATSADTGSSVVMSWTMGNDDFAEFVVEILPLPPAGGPIRLAQQQSRALMKRRKSAQMQQYAAVLPSVTINVQTVTATSAIATPVIIPCITGLGGVPGAGYFTDQSGNPRMIIGDAPWALCGNAGRWNSGNWQADYDTYLSSRASQGYTVVYTKPIGTTQSGNINDNGITFDGLYPFQGGAGANPSTGLTSSFWARIDYFLNSALAKGITVFLNAIGYNSDFNGGPGALNGKSTTEFTAYGTALGGRYKNQPNLVWHLADDYFGSGDSLITAFMTGVSGAGDTHAVSIENMPESDSRNTYDASPSVCSWGTAYAKYNFCYSYNATYVGVEKAYLESSPIPVIQGDGYFSQGGSTYDGSSPGYDRAMRQDAWWAVSSGARGVIQGFESIWQWPSTALAASGTDWYPANNVKVFRTIVESLPNWQNLIPDTSSVLVTGGRGTHAATFASGGSGGQLEVAFTDTYVSASRTAAGDLALIYMSHATTITIDQTKMVSGYTATWIDPVTGAKTAATVGSTYNSTAKGNNSKGNPDWVLALAAPVGSGATATPGTLTATAAFPAPAAAGNGVLPLIVQAAAPAYQQELAGPSQIIGVAQAAVSATASPAALSAAASFPAPAVSGGAIAAPAALAVSATLAAAAASGSAIASPATLAAAAAFPGAAASPVPATLAVAVSQPAAAVSGGAIAAPASLAATSAQPAVTASGSAVVTAAVLTASAAFPAPVVRQDAVASPAVLAASTALPAATVSPGPATLLAAASLPAPAGSGSAIAAPAVLTATAAFPAVVITPGPAVLVASANFPAPAVSGSAAVSPATLTVTASLAGTAVSPGPAVLAATAAFPAPVVRQDQNIAPATLAVATSVPTPAVSTSGNANVSAVTLTVTTTEPAPVVRQDRLVSALVLTVTAAQPPPAVSPGPATLAVTAAQPAVTAAGPANTGPAALGAAAAFPAVTASGGAIAAPAALGAAAAFPAPAESGSASAAPATLTTSASFPAAAVSPGPAVLTAAAVFPAPSVTTSGNASVTPAALVATAAFPAPAVTGSAIASPAVLTAAASFPAARVSPGPATLTAVCGFPAPAVTGSGNATVTPGTVTAATAFPAPAVGGGTSPHSADTAHATESAFYYISGPPDTASAAEGGAAMAVRAADKAQAADVPLSAWPAAHDAARAVDRAASAWPFGTDMGRATEGYGPFRFAGADSAHAADTVNEMGIWTYVPVNVHLLGTFWRVTGLDEHGNEVTVAEGERLSGELLRTAEAVSWSRVTTLVASADFVRSAEAAGELVGVTCWVSAAVQVTCWVESR